MCLRPRGAELAAQYAWEALGGRGDLPPVHYVAGLVDGEDWGRTVGGEIWLQLDACPREPNRICRPSQTSLVHELNHVVLGGDPEHRDPRWRELVPQIKRNLEAEGL